MTKKEKAIEIIKQHGGCTGVYCDSEEKNECPCYCVCGKIDGSDNPHPDKETECRMFLFGGKEPDAYEPDIRKPPAEKTLLDEFAIAAMAAIVGKVPLCTRDEDKEALARGAYLYAAAMMQEKMRRDEMGNVKEDAEQ